jgi:hypothetical protein
LFEIAEAADPQELFFEGAKEALDASLGPGRQLHRMVTAGMQASR